MTATALASSMPSTAPLPAVDLVREAKLDRGIRILTELKPARCSSHDERLRRAENFRKLMIEYGTTEGEAHPLMVEVAAGRTDEARRFLNRKLEDMIDNN